MLLLDKLAEHQIERHIEATDCGANTHAGQALDLTVDAHVPPQVRALYRVLKQSGFVPAEVALHNEIKSLNQLLSCVTCEQEQGRAARRLQALELQLELKGRGMTVRPTDEYQQRLVQRMDAHSGRGHG